MIEVELEEACGREVLVTLARGPYTKQWEAGGHVLPISGNFLGSLAGYSDGMKFYLWAITISEGNGRALAWQSTNGKWLVRILSGGVSSVLIPGLLEPGLGLLDT